MPFSTRMSTIGRQPSLRSLQSLFLSYRRTGKSIYGRPHLETFRSRFDSGTRAELFGQQAQLGEAFINKDATF
jgi:hypothetical protein